MIEVRDRFTHGYGVVTLGYRSFRAEFISEELRAELVRIAKRHQNAPTRQGAGAAAHPPVSPPNDNQPDSPEAA